ncbi:phosphate butyryltransferase [Bacillus stratosphericus]|nr:phosphate butyryltransferase [Bacillus stratosphericus]
MKLDDLIMKAAQLQNKTAAVAHAEDEEVLHAIKMAIKRKVARFLLVGNKRNLKELVKQHEINEDWIDIIHSDSPEESAKIAVQAVSEKHADILMKGHVPTAVLLKAVLNKEYGLRTTNVLSHVAAFEVPGFDRFIYVTDSAMNIAPDLNMLKEITINSVQVAQAVGNDMPKVAVLSAVEVVNPAMDSTLTAASLAQMNRRGQISGCLIDGPLALDNAISQTAASHKNITSDVAGHADILLVPTIEAGNILYKSLIYFAHAKVGAVVAGAKAPIALTSRSDSAESKLYSIALAICTSN